jgi:hypothetical protein
VHHCGGVQYAEESSQTQMVLTGQATTLYRPKQFHIQEHNYKDLAVGVMYGHVLAWIIQNASTKRESKIYYPIWQSVIIKSR